MVAIFVLQELEQEAKLQLLALREQKEMLTHLLEKQKQVLLGSREKNLKKKIVSLVCSSFSVPLAFSMYHAFYYFPT